MISYLFLLPFLALYAFVAVATSHEAFQGDEARYVMFATNLTHGYYSPPDRVDLWNGPGYPLVLAPFVFFELPWLAARMLNALFLLGALVYFCRTLRFFLPERRAIVATYLLGLYPTFVMDVRLLYTESLTLFLLGGFLFYFWRLHRQGRAGSRSLLLAAGFLAYLALTKVFFGYVILAVLALFFALYLRQRTTSAGRSLQVCALALIFCLPYLSYTYSLTGKVYYWATSGGMSLYWMSTPYEGEYGDWHAGLALDEIPQLAENHDELFSRIVKLDSVQSDDEFKKQAVHNITHSPKRFLRNWAANVGRLLFSFPYSYTPQKLSTYFYLIPNMFIVVGTVISLYPALRARKLIPHEVYASLLFALIAFGGSSLLSAYERQFRILVPILALWLIYIFTQIVRIEIRSKPLAPGSEIDREVSLTMTQSTGIMEDRSLSLMGRATPRSLPKRSRSAVLP